MSSRQPQPLTAGAHDRAARKRNRRVTVALRRAAGDHGASREAGKIGRWLADCDGATITAIRCAKEPIVRALNRRQHVDQGLIERLQDAVDRLELHATAGRLHLHPNVLLDVREKARDVAAKLFAAA